VLITKIAVNVTSQEPWSVLITITAVSVNHKHGGQC